MAETRKTGPVSWIRGIKTPKREIDLIKDRLKRLKEMLR
jgi:phage-related protein